MNFAIPVVRPIGGYHSDPRGYFSRLFDLSRDYDISQGNIALSNKAGTLRGLHYLRGSKSEIKRIRVLSGAIIDFALDIRLNSPSYGKLFVFELSSPAKELFVPKHFAHGYLSLEENTIVSYLVDEEYDPDYDSGFKFSAEQFGISLPIPITSISEKDAHLPTFRLGLGERNCSCCAKK
jgi:dTDP-4-dehydrorhamnose 3,5-epimerase